MSLLQIINQIELFIAQWAGTTTPRIVVAFLGVLVCVWIGMAIWEKRIRVLWAIGGIVLGLFMVVIAIDPRILRFLAETGFLTRIRILMVIMSCAVVIITIEAIRRSHLQERYAILWVTTGLIILVTAFFPHILALFSFLFGTQYVTSVVGIVFAFLLLIAFHFSIALSGMQKRQTQIAQRCAILEAKLEDLSRQFEALQSNRPAVTSAAITEPTDELPVAATQTSKDAGSLNGVPRPGTGRNIVAAAVVAVAFLAVLITGFITPQAMIGDEVTHYYMLVDQSRDLSRPNFHAHIPVGWGGDEVRRYPHSCLWHYLGALFFRVSGGSFRAVQAYHALFWLQFLVVAFLLATDRKVKASYAPALYLLVLASLPVSLIFSVAFYQDIPMAAQVLTAFYLLRKRKWLWASIFMALAVGLKISALLFLPAFFVLTGWWEYRAGSWRTATAALAISGIILGSSTWGMGWALKQFAGAGFYPQEQLEKVIKKVKENFSTPVGESLHAIPSTGKQPAAPKPIPPAEKAKAASVKSVTPYEAEIIANHPGDLRIPVNFLIYGGGILWLVILAGIAALLYRCNRREARVESGDPSWWLFAVGMSYIALSAYFIRTAPDARFFLPGLPFVLLPFVEAVAGVPKVRGVIAIVAAMAILQGGEVLKKTHDLRNVSPGLKDTITFLKANPVSPPRIFMYPEGNYRLFPHAHEWYLKYRLREFWKGDNDLRIAMLRQFKIGAVVIKKHLIADVDDDITNLGVYPSYFVSDVEKDKRFRKVFDNRDVVIYKVP